MHRINGDMDVCFRSFISHRSPASSAIILENKSDSLQTTPVILVVDNHHAFPSFAFDNLSQQRFGLTPIPSNLLADSFAHWGHVDREILIENASKRNTRLLTMLHIALFSNKTIIQSLLSRKDNKYSMVIVKIAFHWFSCLVKLSTASIFYKVA